MKRTLLLLFLLLPGGLQLRADDKLHNVQTELKNQGFYYGEVDGKSSPELTAAVRRYQIRNGLEVSGELSNETLDSLGIGGAKAAPSTAAKSAPAKPTQAAPQPAPIRTQRPPVAPQVEEAQRSRPPLNLRRDEAVVESDRRAFPQNADRIRPPGAPATVRPPAPLDAEDPTVPERATGGEYAEIFADTPYATAPRVLQDETIRRAQRVLADRGYYRDAIDGLPGPATEEALLMYQRIARLPLTGRLDLQTLNTLRLLPGRGSGNPPLQPFNSGAARPIRPQTTFRGIWVE